MPTDASSNSLAHTLGAAHLTWAALLCAGGIYGLAASQPANSSLAESLGIWNLCFTGTGTAGLAGISLLHVWGGQSLRREGTWPAPLTWGLFAAGGILTLTAIGVLSRGMQARLLLAGCAPIVGVLLAGGTGTLALSAGTKWLIKNEATGADVEPFARGEETLEDVAESTFLRSLLGLLPSLVVLANLALAIWCEAVR